MTENTPMLMLLSDRLRTLDDMRHTQTTHYHEIQNLHRTMQAVQSMATDISNQTDSITGLMETIVAKLDSITKWSRRTALAVGLILIYSGHLTVDQIVKVLLKIAGI